MEVCNRRLTPAQGDLVLDRLETHPMKSPLYLGRRKPGKRSWALRQVLQLFHVQEKQFVRNPNWHLLMLIPPSRSAHHMHKRLLADAADFMLSASCGHLRPIYRWQCFVQTGKRSRTLTLVSVSAVMIVLGIHWVSSGVHHIAWTSKPMKARESVSSLIVRG